MSMESAILILPVISCLMIIIAHVGVMIYLRASRHMPERILDGTVVTAYSIFCCYYVEHIWIVG